MLLVAGLMFAYQEFESRIIVAALCEVTLDPPVDRASDLVELP